MEVRREIAKELKTPTGMKNAMAYLKRYCPEQEVSRGADDKAKKMLEIIMRP